MQPSVSLLIPTYNRHDVLVDALRGCLMQNYSPLEIVVFDQSSSHPGHVNAFLTKNRHAIKIVRGEPHGVVHAYRQCVRHASGDICVFIDDDVLIDDREFVAKHVRALKSPGVGAICGQVLHKRWENPAPQDPRVHSSRFPWMFVRFNSGVPMADMPSLSACNMSFHRYIYERTDGFDQNYRTHGFRFETDFSFAVKRAGYKINFDPSISLVHRYHTPGGAANAWLGSMDDQSIDWYRDFFFNTWYFLVKWYGFYQRLYPAWFVLREHAMNRAVFMKKGLRFVCRRVCMYFGAYYDAVRLAQKSISTNEKNIDCHTGQS